MLVNGPHRGTRDQWSWAAAMSAATLLLLTLVLPAAAASAPNRLSNPDISPRNGAVTTVLTARASYRNNDGSPAEDVSVAFGGGPAHEKSILTGGTTTGPVAMAMAFGLFGKRRRAGEPLVPDEQLAVAAAVGAGVRTFPLAVPDIDETEDPEAQMPRWRRPSLLQARRTDPTRDATPAARLRFDQSLFGPSEGLERRLIRYRLVRMLDSPDELRGSEIGYLDRDDEVQPLEKYGAYWLVLCPDGRQGWVHNMTIGEVIDETLNDDRLIATMPLAPETWTMGDGDQDTDVLDAYLESRRRQT